MEDYYYRDTYVYSEEGKKRICKVVENAETESQSTRIFTALEAEKKSFDNFSSALDNLLSDI